MIKSRRKFWYLENCVEISPNKSFESFLIRNWPNEDFFTENCDDYNLVLKDKFKMIGTIFSGKDQNY
jgi:hypothetical protein